MKPINFLITLFVVLSCLSNLLANNLQITNVNLPNDSTLNFNISWENSWRVGVAPNNHDAAWIFIKRRDCASGQWSHVDLSSTPADHSAAAPLEVYIDGKDASPEAKGLFLRRAAVGVGNITNAAISIRLKGLEIGEFDFRVFGIEMVQIPEESFYLGDGTGGSTVYRDGNTFNPFLVSSEDSINVGSSVGSLSTASTSYLPLPLPAAFPKGYAQIYCMKYEITHRQYVDFMNLLASDQIIPRNISVTVSRHNITGAWPNKATLVPHRAMGYLGWADLLAYLDWSALRPMTDLEFEKICRGPVTPIANEYAWGTNLVSNATVVVNDGTPTEGSSSPITPGAGLAKLGTAGIAGPLRVGFAAKTATSRLEAGATFYGVMEMTGNIHESVIGTRAPLGVAFTGDLGDGEVTKSPVPGFADVSSWPSKNAPLSTSSSSAPGKCIKGGAWTSTLAGEGKISDRIYANYPYGQRYNSQGGRGVR